MFLKWGCSRLSAALSDSGPGRRGWDLLQTRPQLCLLRWHQLQVRSENHLDSERPSLASLQTEVMKSHSSLKSLLSSHEKQSVDLFFSHSGEGAL